MDFAKAFLITFSQTTVSQKDSVKVLVTNLNRNSLKVTSYFNGPNIVEVSQQLFSSFQRKLCTSNSVHTLYFSRIVAVLALSVSDRFTIEEMPCRTYLHKWMVEKLEQRNLLADRYLP